jgi:HlyD family secretion protein
MAARADSDASGYRERLGFARDVETMRKTLEERDAGSKLNTLIASDARAEIQRSLANSEETARAARLERAALSAERDAYVRNWRGTVSQQLSDTSSKASDAREQLNKAKLRRQLVELRAEHSAIVQSLAKVSVGSVLQSGQPFITLVPSDAPLEVEANISGGDAGFVHVRNSAVIKFDTFPYSQYGLAEGKLRVVSPDSFAVQSSAQTRDPTSGGVVPATTNTEPFYRARISIDHIGLHDVPAGFRVVPGMPVTVDVLVGKRTVLQYFLGIILPITREGMREP